MKYNKRKLSIITLAIVINSIIIFGIIVIPQGYRIEYYSARYKASAIDEQAPWNYTWGGDSGDWGRAIALDAVGNAYVAGYTDSFGAVNTDMCLVKFNSIGVDWSYMWGGDGDDRGNGVAMDTIGNGYVTGRTTSYGAVNDDLCLIKFNSVGGIVWNYTWGGDGDDRGNGVAVDARGNAYVTGSTDSFGASGVDMCLIKFNPAGGIVWNYTWGGISDDRGNGVALDADGNAYVAGNTWSFGAGNSDIWVVKFNPAGGIVWNYTWGGIVGDWGRAIALDADGNAYVAGFTNNFGAVNSDMCLVKFNSSGVEWSYMWGGDGDDWGNGVAVDADGNAYVAGYTDSFGAVDTDMCLVKFNSTGVIWNYTWGGLGNDLGYAIALDVHGNACIAGDTPYGSGGWTMGLVKFKIGDVLPVPYPLVLIPIVIIASCIIIGIGFIGNQLIKRRNEKKADALYQEISQRPESLPELLPPDPTETERSTTEMRSTTSTVTETSKLEPPPLTPSTTVKGTEGKSHKAKPSKKGAPAEEIKTHLTPAELDELKKTMTEVGVEELKIICVVHKGPVEGNIYLCPNCKTFYCVRCATTLKERGEKCWTCSNELKV